MPLMMLNLRALPHGLDSHKQFLKEDYGTSSSHQKDKSASSSSQAAAGAASSAQPNAKKAKKGVKKGPAETQIVDKSNKNSNVDGSFISDDNKLESSNSSMLSA